MPYLTNQDKKNIIIQRLRSVESSQYNLQLNIKEINVTANPDSTVIDRINSQISDCLAEITMLNSELDKVQAEIDSSNNG